MTIDIKNYTKTALLIGILIFSHLEAFNGFPENSCIRDPKAKASRPSKLGERYRSDDGHFLLHYTNSGPDSVSQIYALGEKTPDYIIYAAQWLEQSYRLHHDTLGFRIPPVDDRQAPEVDVYFYDLGGGNYGGTVPESNVTASSRPHDWTSYMDIHSTFEGSSFYTGGYEALKVTCAHEYFHVVQLGYGVWEWTRDEIWFLEASSVWMEERAFPAVDDYVQYFYSFATRYRGRPIDEFYYANTGFNMMLEEKFPGAMLEIWENIISDKVEPSIRFFLNKHYSQDAWAHALADFAFSAAACGDYSNAALSVYPDAPDLPEIEIPSNARINALFGDGSSYMIEGASYAADYYNMLYPNGMPAMEIRMASADPIAVELLIRKGTVLQKKSLNSASIYISKYSGDSEIIFCVGNGRNDDSETLQGTLYFSRPVLQISNVYPNPTDGRATHIDLIYSSDEINYRYNIYNILGQRIYASDNVSSAGQRVTFIPNDLMQGNLPDGLYFIRLESGDFQFTRKFIYIRQFSYPPR